MRLTWWDRLTARWNDPLDDEVMPVLVVKDSEGQVSLVTVGEEPVPFEVVDEADFREAA